MDGDLPVDLAKFGRRVRKTREAQGLSLRDLAVRVGMSNPALLQAERGIKLSGEGYDFFASLAGR